MDIQSFFNCVHFQSNSHHDLFWHAGHKHANIELPPVCRSCCQTRNQNTPSAVEILLISCKLSKNPKKKLALFSSPLFFFNTATSLPTFRSPVCQTNCELTALLYPQTQLEWAWLQRRRAKIAFHPEQTGATSESPEQTLIVGLQLRSASL